jgi:hypothetical protein
MLIWATLINIIAIVAIPAILGSAFESWMIWGILAFVTLCMGFFNVWRSFGDLLSGVIVGLATGLGIIIVGFIYNAMFAAGSPFHHLWPISTELTFPTLNLTTCIIVGAVFSVIGGWISRHEKKKTQQES